MKYLIVTLLLCFTSSIFASCRYERGSEAYKQDLVDKTREVIVRKRQFAGYRTDSFKLSALVTKDNAHSYVVMFVVADPDNNSLRYTGYVLFNASCEEESHSYLVDISTGFKYK